jgi:outer membrane protein OmpA-like peptidoglycan-associated protein
LFGRVVYRRNGKQEGESPFWISFADLMSALMVLFLVVMAVTLVVVAQSIPKTAAESIERRDAVNKIMKMLGKELQAIGAKVDPNTQRITLEDKVKFELDNDAVSPSAAQYLRRLVPVLLHASDTPEGRRWLRNVVVEGYTSDEGTYLLNLQLSLDRSRSVVCALFQGEETGDALSSAQLRKVQELFLVGGYSFNSMKLDRENSRRVEFKLEFWGLGENRPPSTVVANGKGYGTCRPPRHSLR